MTAFAYAALASFAVTRTLADTATVQPGQYNDPRVHVDFGDEADITSTTWHLKADVATEVEDWAIQLDLNSDFTFSSWISTVDFVVSGERVTTGGDMFFGFGDGHKYFSLATDFDGGLTTGSDGKGVAIYPQCGGALASGDVSSVLTGSSQYGGGAQWELRAALAGGNKNNWRQIGGSRHDNGNKWPVTIEVTNNIIADEVTVKFLTQSVQQECVYQGAFATDTDLTFGVMPDANDDADEFNIHFITVAKAEVDVCDGHCDASAHSPAMNVDVDAPESGSWTVELSGKDMLIMILCAINLITLIAVIFSCSRFARAGPLRKKYERVSVQGDSEREQFQN